MPTRARGYGRTMSDLDDDQPADEDVMGTAGGPTTVPDATEADPDPDDGE
jgi:hypothetical protein